MSSPPAAPNTPDAVTVAWDEIKRRERAAKPASPLSLLDDVPRALPALVRAIKLQNRAAEVGFDWPNAVHVTDKIAEETRELAEAHASGQPPRLRRNSAICCSRWPTSPGISSSTRKTRCAPPTPNSSAVSRRSRRVLKPRAGRPEDATLEEMEALWQEAKKSEGKRG